MKRLNYAIVFVSDMQRSVAFYRDVLGLPLAFESPGWSELANEGTTIALHKGHGAAADASGEEPGTCRLGFQVDDIDALHRDLVAKGVPCLAEPNTAGFGIRQALYADPDGFAFTVAQRLESQVAT